MEYFEEVNGLLNSFLLISQNLMVQVAFMNDLSSE